MFVILCLYLHVDAHARTHSHTHTHTHIFRHGQANKGQSYWLRRSGQMTDPLQPIWEVMRRKHEHTKHTHTNHTKHETRIMTKTVCILRKKKGSTILTLIFDLLLFMFDLFSCIKEGMGTWVAKPKPKPKASLRSDNKIKRGYLGSKTKTEPETKSIALI